MPVYKSAPATVHPLPYTFSVNSLPGTIIFYIAVYGNLHTVGDFYIFIHNLVDVIYHSVGR